MIIKNKLYITNKVIQKSKDTYFIFVHNKSIRHIVSFECNDSFFTIAIIDSEKEVYIHFKILINYFSVRKAMSLFDLHIGIDTFRVLHIKNFFS